MKTNWMYFGVVASLTLAQASLAQEISRPMAALGTASATRTVTCHGITSVPMTADAEQALPMKVVAVLNCGDSLSIFSDTEGYTVGVRTNEGKSGYVARMYLSEAAPFKAAPKVESSDTQNGVARWELGAPGSDQFNNNDQLVESLTVNGITVQVSLQDTGWKLRANVAVRNDSMAYAAIVPSRFTLEEHAPNFKSLAYQDPKKMAKAVNHQILWTASNAAPVTATPHMSAASYKTVQYDTPKSTNYLARNEADVQLVSEHKADFNPAAQMEAVALPAASLSQGQETAGVVWFERDNKTQSRQLLLRVPVGDTVFEFPLTFQKRK